jgi:hypothetical protein
MFLFRLSHQKMCHGTVIDHFHNLVSISSQQWHNAISCSQTQDLLLSMQDIGGEQDVMLSKFNEILGIAVRDHCDQPEGLRVLLGLVVQLEEKMMTMTDANPNFQAEIAEFGQYVKHTVATNTEDVLNKFAMEYSSSCDSDQMRSLVVALENLQGAMRMISLPGEEDILKSCSSTSRDGWQQQHSQATLVSCGIASSTSKNNESPSTAHLPEAPVNHTRPPAVTATTTRGPSLSLLRRRTSAGMSSSGKRLDFASDPNFQKLEPGPEMFDSDFGSSSSSSFVPSGSASMGEKAIGRVMRRLERQVFRPGMSLSSPSEWVQKAAPVLIVGVCLLKLGLLIARFRLSVPQMSQLLSSIASYQEHVNSALATLPPTKFHSFVSENGGAHVAADSADSITNVSPSNNNIMSLSVPSDD